GWHTAERIPDRITRAVFGGIPDADPMRRVRVDQAKAQIGAHAPVLALARTTTLTEQDGRR
ncbi:hypothetical protein IAE22_33320, partial [Bacillus sp. S34]|nr:hypothetical protein [Bacillus sp. S34]